MIDFHTVNTRLISTIFIILIIAFNILLAVGLMLYFLSSSPIVTEIDVNQTDNGNNLLELVKEAEHVNTSKLPQEINDVSEVEAVNTELIDQGSREKDNPSAQARIAKFDTGGDGGDGDTDRDDWYIDN